MMPADVAGAQLSPQEARERIVQYCYSGEDWRPGRAAPACPITGQRSPYGVNSEGIGEAMGGTCGSSGWASVAQQERRKSTGSVALGNYLNDMKRLTRTRRMAPAAPSPGLLRVNDLRHKLPVEMNMERRSASCDTLPRSPKVHPNAESDASESIVYGFTRRKLVRGHSGQLTPRGFLHHKECSSEKIVPRSERWEQSQQRFNELVAHIKATSAEQQERLESIRAQSADFRRAFPSERSKLVAA